MNNIERLLTEVSFFTISGEYALNTDVVIHLIGLHRHYRILFLLHLHTKIPKDIHFYESVLNSKVVVARVTVSRQSIGTAPITKLQIVHWRRMPIDPPVSAYVVESSL